MDRWKTGKIHPAFIVAFAILLCGKHALAQSSSIEIGKYVNIAPCAKEAKSLKYIDIYTKSLVTDTVIPIDSVTGEGVYESFFVKGVEIDGKRLPCIYSGKKYKVASLREFQIKGVPTRVMLLYSNKPNELLWVLFDKAVEQKEISW